MNAGIELANLNAGIELANMLTDEYRYKILKLVQTKPDISQRELAKELGVSLGKANFCLKVLIEKGLLKATNFRNSQNKLAYMYLLTPSGVEEKSKITLRFLKSKMQEYELLQQELKVLVEETKSQLNDSHQLSDNKSTDVNFPVVFSETK